MELSQENIVAHKHANKKRDKFIKLLNQYVTGSYIKAYFILLFVKFVS